MRRIDVGELVFEIVRAHGGECRGGDDGGEQQREEGAAAGHRVREACRRLHSGPARVSACGLALGGGRVQFFFSLAAVLAAADFANNRRRKRVWMAAVADQGAAMDDDAPPPPPEKTVYKEHTYNNGTKYNGPLILPVVCYCLLLIILSHALTRSPLAPHRTQAT